MFSYAHSLMSYEDLRATIGESSNILNKANGHALLAKSCEKRAGRGVRGSDKFLQFLTLPPKGPNEWRNIPFF